MKNTGEEEAAHKEFWNSAEGPLKLWLNIDLGITVVKHQKERTARKQKTEQFLELLQG